MKKMLKDAKIAPSRAEITIYVYVRRILKESEEIETFGLSNNYLCEFFVYLGHY